MIKNCLHCGKPIQSKRSTKKYCSDSCKQLAFYKRSGLALSGLNGNDSSAISEQHTVKKPFNDNEIIDQPAAQEDFRKQLAENLPVKLLNDKQSVTVNNTITLKHEQAEIPYQQVRSKMIDSIADNVDNREALFMFQHPAKYWGAYTLANIKWVSLRLRCLLENLIRLSNSSAVDYNTIVILKEAFTALINAYKFKGLPGNYPFIALTKEMEQKIAVIAKEHKDYDSILLRLTLNRKVEIIAARFILADFVPMIKFSELNFND